jgi:2-polyprenyl-3-methyl-5-hydroxy-6-metoxy-1,4-benzoquinol methylase
MPNKANFQRPNLTLGIEADQNYADMYVQGHIKTSPDDPQYRLLYADVLLVDSLLTGYTRLEVGCGTGGYLRIAKNHKHIVGIDFSRSTIDAAIKYQQQFGVERVTYQTCLFEEIKGGPFDCVSIRGIYGHYRPWKGNEAVLKKVRELLRPGGVLIASFVPPARLFQYAKAVLFPKKTIVLRETAFYAMMAQEGFQKLNAFDAEGPKIAILSFGPLTI